jgi:hypothetical protein
MLRITVHQNPVSCTFQLEGRLAGAWVREVEECRRRILAGHRRPSVRFDLTDVTFIDADGRAYVAAMHRQGAQFVAADCLTRAIVAQITSGPIPDRRSSQSAVLLHTRKGPDQERSYNGVSNMLDYHGATCYRDHQIQNKES